MENNRENKRPPIVGIVVSVVMACAIVIVSAYLILCNKDSNDHEVNSEITSITESAKAKTSMGSLTVRMFKSNDINEDEYYQIGTKDPVKILSNYDPASSSSTGIGIHFEFSYGDGEIKLIADHGSFRTWNPESGCGTVEDVGTEYNISEKGDIFWAPKLEEINTIQDSKIKVIVMASNQNAMLTSIKIYSEDDGKTFCAILDKMKAIHFKDESQTLSQKEIDDFFQD